MNVSEKEQFKKELLSLAIPVALQNLLNALVGASDALMLGRLTQEAIAAVSLANQVSFVMSLFSGAVIGSMSVLIAQYWGKGDYKNAKLFLAMAVRYVCIIEFVFFIAAFCFPIQIMRFFTPDDTLIHIGSNYLRIVAFSYLFACISQCFLMLMKVCGKTIISVWISAVTVIVDMVADFFLIYGFGPIKALGANGSAYSTVAVEAIALIWCITWSRKSTTTTIRKSELVFFSREFERDAWKLIPPMLASSLSWGLSITMHSFILGHLGTDATAAASVTNVATQLIQCLSHGLATGSGIMIGKLLGANKLDKAKEYGDRFWKISALSGCINIALLLIVGPLVYYFYVLSPAAKSYLVYMLVFNCFYMFAYAFNTIFTCGVFPAGGDAKYDAISVFFATWCFAIPLALVGCFILHWPVMIVYIVMCLDEIVKIPALFIYGKRYVWLKNLTRDPL